MVPHFGQGNEPSPSILVRSIVWVMPFLDMLFFIMFVSRLELSWIAVNY